MHETDALRVLHTFDSDDDFAALRDEVGQLRDEPGCRTAELYTSVSPDDRFHALTAVWASEAEFDAWWDRARHGEYPTLFALVAENDPDDADVDRAGTEIYRQTSFALRDGVWVPEASDEKARTIFWPARGPVRVLIQNAVGTSDAMYAKIRAEVIDTRREEGCVEYAWLENIDLPGHLLLVEVWADQTLYDRHWTLRQRTAAFVGDNLRKPADPERGPVSREFYRYQDFRHHYDRWLPVDPDAHATAIMWPAG